LRSFHIIMPMAGRGSRFLEQGITVPKPLICVERVPIFKRAIDGLNDVSSVRKYSFIVRQEHIRDFSIDKCLLKFYPEAEIIAVEQTTRGAVETCLMAQENIREDEAIAVMDCDLEFYSRSFNREILSDLSVNHPCVAGRLISFDSDQPKYSYAQITKDAQVIRTAEKQVISNHALAGAYYFSRGEYFLSAAHELVRRFETGDVQAKELYISLLYNILLETGNRIQLHKLDFYRSFGTPEELTGMDWSWKTANV